MKMGRMLSVVVAVGTAAINWVVFYGVASRFGSTQAAFMATILLMAIVIYELGHAVVLEANGVKTHLIFLFIVGGCCTDTRYHRKEKALNWNTRELIYAAGVIGNLLMALGGVIFYALGWLNFHEYTQVINLNALLVFYNMFPVWITDGGRFAKTFFDSSPESTDHQWVFRLLVPIIMAALFLNLVSKELFLFTVPIMFWSLNFQSTHDDPNGSYNPKALSTSQQCGWAVAYLAIFITSMAMLSFTPDWIMGK